LRISNCYKKIIFFLIIFLLIPFYVPSKSYGEKKDTILVFEASKLPPSFTKFKELKENEGYDVVVLNINSINGDKVEGLRNYLRQNIENLSIKYLLIVGSDSVFPMKRFMPRSDKIHDQFDGDFVETPSDIYFVDPFEDFDKDKDGNFGEYPDDNIEINPFILVGRIPLDSEFALEKYFSSLVEYEKIPFNKKNSALLIGAYLAFKGEVWYDRNLENEDGADFMEKIINDFIIKNGITPIRVYEKEGSLPSSYISDFSLSNKNITNLLNEKTFGFINISAHGNPYSVARMVWNDRDSDYIFNENESKTYILFNIADIPAGLKGGVLFASSCLTAYPESEINLSREFLSKGGSAYIGATRISWGPTYWKEPDDGGLLTINYLFVKNFIDLHQTTGDAFWNSIADYHKNYFENDKEDPIEAAQMNTFTFNLFGDPTLKYSLEDDSFSISTLNYSEYSFKNDLIFLKYHLLKGENFNKEIDLSKYGEYYDGFIYQTKEISEIYRIDELNYEKDLRLIDIKEFSYLFKKEYEEKIELIYFGKEKDVILRFSDNLVPENAKYFDNYRNITIFKVKDGDSLIFKKINKEEFFINSNDPTLIIYKDKKFDYNSDGIVNKKDFYIFSKHFGVISDDKLYMENFDIYLDNKIDGLDLIYLSINNGEVIK